MLRSEPRERTVLILIWTVRFEHYSVALKQKSAAAVAAATPREESALPTSSGSSYISSDHESSQASNQRSSSDRLHDENIGSIEKITMTGCSGSIKSIGSIMKSATSISSCCIQASR